MFQVAVLIDSKYRTVYALRNMTLGDNHFSLEYITFYMQFMPDGRLIFHELNTPQNLHRSNNGRMLWTEDPYYRKVCFTFSYLHG